MKAKIEIYDLKHFQGMTVLTESLFNEIVKDFFVKDLMVRKVFYNPELGVSPLHWDSRLVKKIESPDPDFCIWEYYVTQFGVGVQWEAVKWLKADEIGLWIEPRFPENVLDGVGT